MRKLLLLLLFCITTSTFAQTNFVDGFIIQANQTDTLKGLIDDQNWGVNPIKITFKTNNVEKDFSINELASFGSTNKEHYVVKKVDLDITPNQSSALLKVSKRSIVKDTIVALLVLLKAENGLYYFTDKREKEHYFYDVRGSKMKELVQHKYLKKNEDKTYEVQSDLYIKELDSLFRDCDELKNRAKNAVLQQNSLTDLFIDFNKCKGCNYTCYIKKSQDKNKIVFGIVAGTSIIGKKVYSRNYLSNSVYDEHLTVFSPIIGINTSVYSKRNRGSRSLLMEILYENEKLNSQTSEYSITKNNFYFNALYRRLILLQNKIHPFYGFGFNIKYSTSQILSNQFKSFSISSGEITNQILAEIGFEYKKIQFSVKAKYQIIDKDFVTFQYYNSLDIIENDRLNFQTSVSYQFR
jgi:hypothetical protein